MYKQRRPAHVRRHTQSYTVGVNRVIFARFLFLRISRGEQIQNAGPPMGLTESGPILASVRFVKPATFKWRDTSQSVYRYALLRVDMKINY